MPAQGQNQRQTNDERPVKRSRVSRACDQCRTAREKCDGSQPSCLTCSASNRACTYTAPPKKRGIQPGYIRTLELALTWLFQNTDSEAVLNTKLAQEGASSILFGRDTKESNKLHKSWRRSKFCKDVDKLLSGEQLEPGLDPSPQSDDEDTGPEGEQPIQQAQLSVMPQENEVSPSANFISSGLPVPIHESPFVPDTNTGVVAALPQQPVGATPLPANTWGLLEIYFAYTQSWLPICEKHDMLRVSYSYPDAGLVLSESNLPNHGDHAELWSILALAAHQERMITPEQERATRQDPAHLYEVALGLIPVEASSFAVGHVRAMLNLAVVNLASGSTETAWVLVGTASRILITIERSSQTVPARWKHLLAGCFMLDKFLSLDLRRRPYLRKSDFTDFGPIEEDGLEEWQPWAAPAHGSSNVFTNTPGLSLSSFNKLTALVEILDMCNLEGTSNPKSSPQHILRELESWKASLPMKFNYISDELKATPLNPPAVLLQLTYLCCVSSLLPSPTHVQRMSESLTQHVVRLGLAAVPPVILCLLEHIQADPNFNTLDPRLQSSVHKHESEFLRAWSPNRDHRLGSTPAMPAHHRAVYQIPTPESVQVPLNSAYAPRENTSRSVRQRPSISLLDDFLPDIDPAMSSGLRSTGQQGLRMPSADGDLRRPSLHHRNSAASKDLEMFFDELASLDGAEMVDNQPQFMQNLGFAPDANMADFLALELGQYIPTNSSAFMPQSNDPTHLDPAFFEGT